MPLGWAWPGVSRLVPLAPGVLCLGGGKTPKRSGPDFLVGVSTCIWNLRETTPAHRRDTLPFCLRKGALSRSAVFLPCVEPLGEFHVVQSPKYLYQASAWLMVPQAIKKAGLKIIPGKNFELI